MADQQRVSLAPFFYLTIITALILLTHVANLRWLWSRWMENPDYSHGPLIPLISLFIIYQKRTQLSATVLKGSNWGLLVLIFAVFIQVVSLRAQVSFIASYSIILAFIGVILFLYGKKIFSVVAFPLLYLIFMVPFWGAAMDKLGNSLKFISSILSFHIIQMLGYPVFRDGVMLHMAKGSLEVADPCSGIRSLFSLLAMGTLIAYFSSGGFTKKACLILLSIVLAVLGNSLRVVTFAVILQQKGIVISEGPLHTAIGMGVFVFALAGLLAFSRWVKL